MRKSAWQPIETAPRGSGEDGPDTISHHDYVEPPRLLLWTESEGVVIGYYDWYFHPGYGASADDGESAWRDDTANCPIEPTHWMELPKGPSDE